MDSIKILNSNPIQNNFYGLNAVYHGFAGISDTDGRVLNEELCELEADRAKDQNLKIARTFYKWYSYDFENKCWNWDSAPDYLAFCKWVERMKVRGIDVALNAGWCMPGDILSNSWNGITPFTVEGDWQASTENFAKWISDSVYDLVIKRGFTNVKYLIMFTEPQNGAGNLAEETPNTWVAWQQATAAIVARLKKDKLDHLVKLIGPNEGSTADARMMKWVYEKHHDLVSAYSSHNYSFFTIPKPSPNSRVIPAAGGRWYIPVKLISGKEYKMSLELYLKTDIPDTVSGYVLVGAFRRNELGRFGAGGVPTDRLGRYTTHMLEAARLEEKWQEVSFVFTAPENADNALIGIFDDVKQENSLLFFKNVSLKEVGVDTELLKENEWEAFPNYFTAKENDQYEFFYVDTKNKLKYLKEGDELWYDEYNCLGYRYNNYLFKAPDHPYHGTDIAAARLAFLNSGIQNSFLWTLFDQQWPNNHMRNNDDFVDGEHRCGVMPALLRSKVPYPSYFAMRITGLVNGDTASKIYEGVETGEVKGAMVKNSDGNFTVLLVNETNAPREFEIIFENPVLTDLNCYIYDPEKVVCEEKIPPLKSDFTVKGVTDNIKYVIPAKGVIAYSTK